MTSLAPSSFFPATISVGKHDATAVTAVAPWRGILAVEPDSAILNAKVLLLTRANYCVTAVTDLDDLFRLHNTKELALAILSDRLGQRLLGTAATTVRGQWPKVRILIMGQVPIVLEDQRYDEQICRSSDPQRVLADLELLYEGMWNEGSKGIDWNASGSAAWFSRRQISESDPTRAGPPPPAEDRIHRNVPTTIRIPVTDRLLRKTTILAPSFRNHHERKHSRYTDADARLGTLHS